MMRCNSWALGSISFRCAYSSLSLPGAVLAMEERRRRISSGENGDIIVSSIGVDGTRSWRACVRSSRSIGLSAYIDWKNS